MIESYFGKLFLLLFSSQIHACTLTVFISMLRNKYFAGNSMKELPQNLDVQDTGHIIKDTHLCSITILF